MNDHFSKARELMKDLNLFQWRAKVSRRLFPEKWKLTDKYQVGATVKIEGDPVVDVLKYNQGQIIRLKNPNIPDAGDQQEAWTCTACGHTHMRRI